MAGLRGRSFAAVTEENGKYTVNVFGWREGYDSHSGTNSCLNVVMETFYFICGDKEVAYALWSVIDFMSIYGPDATTVEKVESFGFTVSNETDHSIDLSMKGVNIRWEWDSDENWFHFD